MTEAFQCNYCNDYNNGEPAGRFYLHEGRNALEDGKIDADLCEDCLEKFYEEFTLPEYYQ